MGLKASGGAGGVVVVVVVLLNLSFAFLWGFFCFRWVNLQEDGGSNFGFRCFY